MYIPEDLISLLAVGLFIFIVIVIGIKRREFADYWGRVICDSGYLADYNEFINAHPNWGRYKNCKKFVDAVGRQHLIEKCQKYQKIRIEMEERRLRKEGYDQAMQEMKEAAKDNS